MHHNFQLFSKIQCILYSIVFFFSLSQYVNAQESLLDQKITVNYKKTPLRKAFKDIEKQLSCYFTYESATVNNQKKITLSLKNTTLKNVLDEMLNDSSIAYKVVDNHVVIRKKYVPAYREQSTDSIPEILTLRGTIVDEIDGQLLPFSSISIQGYSTGVIANAQGEFVFKLRKKYIDQKICLAHLGYKNLCLSVEDMLDTNQIYKLERTFISIQEVIIRKTDARELIKTALKKIDENYSTKPVYLTGFYRESIKRRDNYMFFSEAVVKIYKSAYTKLYDDEMVKVLKARKMENVTAQDTFAVKLKSGLSAALELDLVKNPLDFLKEENFGDYDYNMADIVTFNDRNVYLIEFQQKEDVKEALYMGKIYIDIEKLAIVGAEFCINPAFLKKAQNNYIAKKNRGLRLRMTSIEYMVNFRLIDNTYYINYVRGLLKMKVRKRPKLFYTSFETSLELAVNDIDTIDVRRFKRKESENLNTIFFEDVHEYDENFWEHYNFIKPDEPLQEAIKKLSTK